MRHKKKTDKLGRKAPHREATLASVVTGLIDHGRVTTTLRIARSAKRYADKMVTLAKKNSLHSRRQAIKFLRPTAEDRKETVRKLFDEWGKIFEARPGGYTRILKLESRRGDNAPMAILEFVGAEIKFKERKKASADEELDVQTSVEGDLQVQQDGPKTEPEKAVDEAPEQESKETAAEVLEQKPSEAQAEEVVEKAEKPEEKPAEEPDAEEDSEEEQKKKGLFGKIFGKNK